MAHVSRQQHPALEVFAIFRVTQVMLLTAVLAYYSYSALVADVLHRFTCFGIVLPPADFRIMSSVLVEFKPKLCRRLLPDEFTTSLFSDEEPGPSSERRTSPWLVVPCNIAEGPVLDEYIYIYVYVCGIFMWFHSFIPCHTLSST